MMKTTRVACAAAILSLVGAFAAAESGKADLVLFHGKIFTSDAVHPYVQALAIRGERIIATGDSAEIEALAGPQTREIDLGGRTVIPGINDAHNHLEVFPADTVELPFKTLDPSWPDVREALAAAVVKARRGAPLLAYIGPTVFTDRDAARDSLDKLAGDHPVFLASVTGHAYILNSRALAIPKTESVLTIVGGKVVYDGKALSAGSVHPRETNP